MSFNKSEISRLFINSVIETFADMTFIDVYHDKDCEEDIEYTSIIGIDFIEPGEGSMLLYLPKECKKHIVENVYGENWKALNDMEIDDCLLEIVNVLAGNFLKNLYGTDKKNVMSFPKMFFDENVLPPMNHNVDLIFNAEGIKFKAQVSLKV